MYQNADGSTGMSSESLTSRVILPEILPLIDPITYTVLALEAIQQLSSINLCVFQRAIFFHAARGFFEQHMYSDTAIKQCVCVCVFQHTVCGTLVAREKSRALNMLQQLTRLLFCFSFREATSHVLLFPRSSFCVVGGRLSGAKAS